MICSDRVTYKDKKNLWLIGDTEKPSWIIVNKIGLDIVSLYTEGNSIEDIARTISKKYNEKYKDIYNDVYHFILELQRAKVFTFAKKPKKEFNSVDINKIVPKSIYLEITNRCNLRCVHCFISEKATIQNELKIHDVKKLINQIAEIGGINLSVTGGEPFLTDKWQDIIEYGVSKGLKIGVVTNGTLITEAIAEFLGNLSIKVQISLDGSKSEIHDQIRGKGAFDATIEGINTLLSYIDVDNIQISITPMSINVYDIPYIYKLIKDMGIQKIVFSKLIKVGRAKSNWSKLKLSFDEQIWLEEFIREKSIYDIARFKDITTCPLGENLRMDSEGFVFPCQSLWHLDHCIGNIKNSTLTEILNGDKMVKIRQDSLKRPFEIKECRRCILRSVCKGGCLASAFAEYGTIWKPDLNCKMRKYLFQDIIFKEKNKKLEV